VVQIHTRIGCIAIARKLYQPKRRSIDLHPKNGKKLLNINGQMIFKNSGATTSEDINGLQPANYTVEVIQALDAVLQNHLP
jgi:hypothetical protein